MLNPLCPIHCPLVPIFLQDIYLTPLTPSFFSVSYQFNPHLSRDETVTNILTKSLTVFPAADFSLCLALLPPSILQQSASTTHATPAAGDPALSEAVQKLAALNILLCAADYKVFWETYESDDLYADLVADVAGFEELVRVRIAIMVGQSAREVERGVLEGWLGLTGRKEEFERFVREVCGWTVEGGMVKVPLNKENEAKGAVVRENVKVERKLPFSFTY